MSTATRAASSKKQAESNRRLIVGAIGALLVLIGVVAIFALTGSDDESGAAPVEDAGDATSETNDVVIEGVALPDYQDVETANGTPAPQASGVGFDAETITLLEPGVPTVIGFFAHWCPHCQAEVDALSKHLAETGLPGDVNVVAVSTSVDSSQDNYPPSVWFESEGWPGPVLADDAQSSLARAYGLSGFPFWAIVDADGNLVTRSAGEVGPLEFDSYPQMARDGAS